eukprot:gene12346-2997_t
MSSSRDKFRGCLVGAIIGDCLGAPFEGSSRGCISREKIETLIGLQSKKLAKASNGSFEYTDDSAMARSICASLLAKNCFDGSDLASRFSTEYIQRSDRGYGSGVITIFDKWKENGTDSDPFLAAKEQFGGSGSYGNGAAMRVAPVALFEKEEEDVIKVAEETSLLTHSNKYGVNGGILQAVAVHKVLFAPSEINKTDLINSLKEAMQKIEVVKSKQNFRDDQVSLSADQDSTVRFSRRSSFSFTKQLERMTQLIDSGEESNDVNRIVECLGNDISAQEAVPAAIFSFIKNSNTNFEEALIYAYTLGGDTDTIGTMTGALAGAHFGFSSIPDQWKRVCEGVDDALCYADQFYNRMFPE